MNKKALGILVKTGINRAKENISKRLNHFREEIKRPYQTTDSYAPSREKPNLFNKAYEFNRPNEAIREGIYPYFRKIKRPSENGTEVVLANGNKCIMFGSNDYLGLSKEPRVVEATIKATELYGSGFGGSRFLNGNTELHEELEERLASFVGKQKAFLFSTGYQANQGIVPLINHDGIYVFADESDHASIVSALLLSRAKKLRFKHNDIESLEKKLAKTPINAEKLIVIDGVFSMEGDIAPLPEICALAERYNAALMVDDAHGLGVIGNKIDREGCTFDGRGTSAFYGLTDKTHIIMGTFSKSFGTIGGFLASEQKVTDYLKHTASSGIFSASLPAGLVAAVLKSLEIIQQEPERMTALSKNAQRMRKGLLKIGYYTGGREEIPIIPIYIGGMFKENREINALLFTKQLEEEGLFVNPVVSPAVKSGKELIRLSVMATHSNEQIDYALEKLEKVGKELNLI